MSLIHAISTDAVLDKAFKWLCQQRKEYSHNNDVWDVRSNWPTLKPQLQQQLRRGQYRFKRIRRFRFN